MNHRRHLAIPILAIIGLLIAACSSSSATPTPLPATSAPASPSPAASASASPSAATSESPAAGGSTSPAAGGGIPGLDKHDDPTLEAQLPGTLNGVTLQKASFKGMSSSALAGPNSQQITGLLGALGKSPSDVSFAIAFDPTGAWTLATSPCGSPALTRAS